MEISGFKYLAIGFLAAGLLLGGCSKGEDDLSDSEVYMLISSLAATVKTWTHPEDLSDNISPDGSGGGYPQVAMNASGEAVIVWRQSDGSHTQVFKSENRDGAWTHPAGLSDNISPDGQEVGGPQVAMNAGGDAVIVWKQSDGAQGQIFKSECRGGVWSHPGNLSDNISIDGHGANSPQVAMSANGEAVIVWQQHDGSNYQIFMSEYRGGSWSHPTGIGDNISPDGQNAESARVVMSADGDAVIVWMQSDGVNNQIFMSEYRDGSWDHPSGLGDNISPDGQEALSPQVAMNADGDAMIVWQQSDGSHTQIFKSEYRNGVWDHPDDLTDNISPDVQNASYPAVAMDDSGDAVIVWPQYEDTYLQLFKSECRSGVWNHPSGLGDSISPAGQHVWYPEVAMSSNGDAVIVWTQSDGSNRQVFKSEYRSGVWTNPSGLDDNISPDGQDAYYPQVATNSSGEAVIVWYQSDGVQAQIFKSEYR